MSNGGVYFVLHSSRELAFVILHRATDAMSGDKAPVAEDNATARTEGTSLPPSSEKAVTGAEPGGVSPRSPEGVITKLGLCLGGPVPTPVGVVDNDVTVVLPLAGGIATGPTTPVATDPITGPSDPSVGLGTLVVVAGRTAMAVGFDRTNGTGAAELSARVPMTGEVETATV